MKKNNLYFILMILLLTSIDAIGQETARVDKIMNKYIFWHSEPVQKYEVVFSFQSNYNPNPCPVISSIGAMVMECAAKESGYQGKQFDAIIVSDGSRDIAIKFLQESNENAIGTIKMKNGKYFYVLSQPNRPFDMVKQHKVFSIETLSSNCLTISQREDKVLKEATKDCKKDKAVFDGILIGNDNIHNTIKFKL